MPCRATCHDCSDDLYLVPSHTTGQDPFTDAFATSHYPPRLPLRPTHLHLALSFDIPSRRVHGYALHTVEAQHDGAATLVLNAEDFSTIHVKCTDDARPLKFSYDGHLIDIIFTSPLAKGETANVHVSYTVEDPIDGLLFSRDGDGFFAVSDHETERARYWLPVVDHPAVRVPITFELTTPVEHDLTVLANGAFVNEVVKAGMKTTNWSMEQPTPSYLTCVAIGRFLRVDAAPHDGKPVAFFAPLEARFHYTKEHLEMTFGRTNDMIRFMEDKTQCKLPWPKYFQWAVGEVSGAMENSSLVSYDEWYLQDKFNTAEKAHRTDSTVVHELAHTWFGDMVVCGDFCHSFLKESFATLISAEWYYFRHGEDDRQYTLANYAESAFAETSEYMRPIVTRRYESSWALFDRHLYTNGASRLNMLRHRLGDKRFWDAVAFYLKKRAWTTVETDDFRRDLEEATGEELVSFFDQWFYSKGHPILDVSFSYDSAKSLAYLSVKQTQADEKRGVGYFDLPIEVDIETSPDVFITHELNMTVSTPSAQLALNLPSRPLQVVLDPRKKSLFAFGKTSGLNDDLSLRALTNGQSFMARHQAARQLHDSGSRRGRAALRAALSTESFWGMRVIIAQLLGKSGREIAATVLASRLKEEEDARVIIALVTALAEIRTENVKDVLLRFVNAPRDTRHGYGAVGTALRGLGRWAGMPGRSLEAREEVGALLLEQLKKHGVMIGDNFAKGQEIASGAVAGLAALRDWLRMEDVMQLVRNSRASRNGRGRAAMVRAVGTAAMWEGRTRRMQAFEFVEDVMKEEGIGKGLRMACASTLAGLADAGRAGEVLDELERSVENQTKADVRMLKRRARRVASARDGGSGKGSASGMEKLTMEVAELKAKLEEVQMKLETKLGGGKEGKGQTGKEENSKEVRV